MEDYMISQDLLKEMQQDGLIDSITDDAEPKPQPLPSNSILSDTKKMINNQINNQINIKKNNIKTSLIPEVSESQENAESCSFNHNSMSKGLYNRNERQQQLLISKDKNNNNINNNYIKEEDEYIEVEDNRENDNNNQNEYEEIENENENNNNEKYDDNKTQSSFTSFGRPKTEFINTSISTEGVESLYCKTNNNLNNINNLTPINKSRIKENFNKNNLVKHINYNGNTNNNKIMTRKIKGKNIKEIKKLQNELNSLTKQFEKIDKSLKNKNEELKKIKSINDNLLKNNNNQKKIIDVLNNEKVMLNSKIISLKDYCNKMETKLISGSKNQHIIEINNKLRKENESLLNEINYNEQDKKELLKQNELLNDEIKILKKEFQSFLENRNDNENIDNNKVSKIISELTKEKKKIKKYEEEIQKLKDDINNKDLLLQKKEEEIQSLNYGKTQMTTIIAHKENEIHNLTIERDSFQQHFQECNNQLRIIKEKIKDYDKMKKDKNEYEETILALSNKEGAKTQKLREQYESVIKKYINEINLLKNEKKELNKQLNEYEIEKCNKINEYNTAVKDKNKYNQLFDKLVNKLNEDINQSINKNEGNNEINNEIYSKIDYEKDKNMKLICQIEAMIN